MTEFVNERPSFFQKLRRNTLVQGIAIGTLALLLQIPVLLIEGLLWERKGTRRAAIEQLCLRVGADEAGLIEAAEQARRELADLGSLEQQTAAARLALDQAQAGYCSAASCHDYDSDQPRRDCRRALRRNCTFIL